MTDGLRIHLSCLVLELEPAKVKFWKQLYLNSCIYCWTQFAPLPSLKQLLAGFWNSKTNRPDFICYCCLMCLRVSLGRSAGLSTIGQWINSFDTSNYSRSAVGYGADITGMCGSSISQHPLSVFIRCIVKVRSALLEFHYRQSAN